MTPTQRIVGVLALVALIGGPVAGTVCATWCAPHRALARSAATATASASAHHGHHHAAAPATRVLANVGPTGCDTHGTPDRDLQATLTALRSDTHNPIAMPATVFDRTAFTLASASHTSSDHGPPLDTSQTPHSRSLVLRV